MITELRVGPVTAAPQWIKAGAFSVLVHGGLVSIGLGLAGLTEPARPDAVIPVEIVFAPPAFESAAPSVAAAASKAIATAVQASIPQSDSPEKISVPEPELRVKKGVDLNTKTLKANPIEVEPPITEPVAEALPGKPIPPKAKEVELETKAEPIRLVRLKPPSVKRIDAPPPRRKPRSPLPPKPVIQIAQKSATGPKKPPLSAPALQQASIAPSAKSAPGKVWNIDKAASIAALNLSSGVAVKMAATPMAGRGNPAPRYPYLARRRGWEGRVVLLVRVAINGKPVSVRVRDGSGYGVLDRAARKAVESWSFKSAKLTGIPVVSTLEVPVVFRLK